MCVCRGNVYHGFLLVVKLPIKQTTARAVIIFSNTDGIMDPIDAHNTKLCLWATTFLSHKGNLS